jgi:two-component system sporulation sensor kinase A
MGGKYSGDTIMTGKGGNAAALTSADQERHALEERPINSDEKFRGIFESAKDCMVFLDNSGRIIDVNKKAVSVFGGSKEELLGKHLTKIGVFSSSNIPRLLTALAGGIAGKEATLNVSTKNKKDQEIRLECAAYPVKVGSKVIGRIVVARDATERKKAERAIRRCHQQFERLFMNIPEAAVYLDKGFRVAEINPRFTQLFGYSLDEIKGKPNVDLIVPEDKKGESYALGEKSKQGYVDYETVRKRKDGSLVHVSLSAAPIVTDDGPVGYVGLYKDITERKEMERKLRQYSERLEELVQKRTTALSESERKYSILVEEASDGVVIIRDGQIVFVNKKGAEIVEYSKEQLIGRPFDQLVSKEQHKPTMERYLMAMTDQDFPTQFETTLVKKNGAPAPVEASCKLISYQGRPALLTIVRDIATRKKLEQEHLKLEKLATLGELATMVAHDLRNPLTAIKNATFYVRSAYLGNSNAQYQTTLEMLSVIEKATLRADDIVNNLLDYATRKPLQKKKQDINALIEKTLTETNIPGKIQVRKRFSREAIAPVDEMQLERVLSNLARNAVQAMTNGGELEIKTHETEDHVEITFTDTGVGILGENMDKLFTPLFTTKAKGIGMGLAICKKIVEQHSGTINVESEVNKGTTFTIKLPKEEKQ